METLVIFNLTKNTEFITYEYTSDSLIYLNSIHKIYKTINKGIINIATKINTPTVIYNSFVYIIYANNINRSVIYNL